MIKTFEQFENHIDCGILQDYFWDIMDAGINCKFVNIEFGGFENVPIILLYKDKDSWRPSASGFQSMMLENPTRSFKVEIANVLSRIKDAHDVSFERFSFGNDLFLIEYDTYRKVFEKIVVDLKQSGDEYGYDRIKMCMADYAYQVMKILFDLPED